MGFSPNTRTCWYGFRTYLYFSVLAVSVLYAAQIAAQTDSTKRDQKTKTGTQDEKRETSSGETTDVVMPPGYSTARTGMMHDFDYFVGGWTTHQRRLKTRGVGSNEWEEFPGNLCMSLYLDGMATIDELYFPTKGTAGLTRSFVEIAPVISCSTARASESLRSYRSPHKFRWCGRQSVQN